MTESTQQVLGICKAVAEIMNTISKKAISSYVISMTRQASHVLEVLIYTTAGLLICNTVIESFRRNGQENLYWLEA